MPARRPLAVAIACSIAAAAPGARADEPDHARAAASRAAALFEEGRALGKAGQWGEACQRFAESHELVPAVGTQLNLADCLEREGKLRRAWQLFDEAAAESERAGPELRTKFARERADALEQRLGLVVVKLAAPDTAGLTVAVDGRTVKPAARIREMVEPGAVDVVVSAPERAPFRRTVRAKRGEKATVAVPPLAAAGAGGRERRRGWVYTAGTFALAGVGLFTYGVLETGYALDAYNATSPSCTRQQCFDDFDVAGQRMSRAVGAGLVGLSLVATGIVIYAVAPRRSRVTVAPAASAGGAGIGVAGRF
jgi:hypothetical protein